LHEKTWHVLVPKLRILQASLNPGTIHGKNDITRAKFILAVFTDL